jgi:hypothetical protein
MSSEKFPNRSPAIQTQRGRKRRKVGGALQPVLASPRVGQPGSDARPTAARQSNGEYPSVPNTVLDPRPPVPQKPLTASAVALLELYFRRSRRGRLRGARLTGLLRPPVAAPPGRSLMATQTGRVYVWECTASARHVEKGPRRKIAPDIFSSPRATKKPTDIKAARSLACVQKPRIQARKLALLPLEKPPVSASFFLAYSGRLPAWTLGPRTASGAKNPGTHTACPVVLFDPSRDSLSPDTVGRSKPSQSEWVKAAYILGPPRLALRCVSSASCRPHHRPRRGRREARAGWCLENRPDIAYGESFDRWLGRRTPWESEGRRDDSPDDAT